MRTIRIRVQGKVQGVFYRQSTLEKALELGIKGSVRNCPEESVEIIATGTGDQLERLIAWCREGPPEAQVIHVTTEELSLQSFNKFSIIRY